MNEPSRHTDALQRIHQGFQELGYSHHWPPLVVVTPVSMPFRWAAMGRCSVLEAESGAGLVRHPEHLPVEPFPEVRIAAIRLVELRLAPDHRGDEPPHRRVVFDLPVGGRIVR